MKRINKKLIAMALSVVIGCCSAPAISASAYVWYSDSDRVRYHEETPEIRLKKMWTTNNFTRTLVEGWISSAATSWRTDDIYPIYNTFTAGNGTGDINFIAGKANTLTENYGINFLGSNGNLVNGLGTNVFADFKTENGKTYYIDEDGEKLIGWQDINNKTYYFKSNGQMIKKSCVIDGIRYKFTSDGVCQGKYTGWIKSSKGRSYYKNGVKYKNRWVKFKSGKQYYIDTDGYARTGWAIINGKGICYFNDKGVWDGKKYYTGYKPKNMKYYLMDMNFSSDKECSYSINYGKYKEFNDFEVVLEILENDKDTEFSFDEVANDEQYLNENIYHGGKQLIIRYGNSGSRIMVFTKDNDGNSYFYNPYYGFGCKLSDKGAYDRIYNLIK